jgi:hypothetical protein
MTTPTSMPDLSSRPLQCTVERRLEAPPKVLYRALTEQWDLWFEGFGLY